MLETMIENKDQLEMLQTRSSNHPYLVGEKTRQRYPDTRTVSLGSRGASEVDFESSAGGMAGKPRVQLLFLVSNILGEIFCGGSCWQR